MLHAPCKAHVAIRNAGGELFLFRELRVRCRRWMNGKAACVADIGYMVVKLQCIDEFASCLLAARQLETDQPSEITLEVAVGAFAMDALLLGGMDDPLDLLSRAQEINHGLCVLAVLVHAQCKRLQALDDQECIERRQRRADIAQERHPCLDREADRTDRLSCFRPYRAVIARVWRIERRLPLRMRSPSEISPVKDH